MTSKTLDMKSIAEISTIFVKVDTYFGERFSQERVAKLEFFSLHQQMQFLPLTTFLTNFHSKFEMPQIMKMASLEKMQNFCIGRFLKCLSEIWRTWPKF
jgi:hypothetical protein